MAAEYRRNHYVPAWYQRGFLPDNDKKHELYYLDLDPGTFVKNGESHPLKALRKVGVKRCFFQEDLYTTKVGELESTDIERVFFGEIDTAGRNAVEAIRRLKCSGDIEQEHFQNLMLYLSTQKLRTPKGLDWLKSRLGNTSRTQLLGAMTSLSRMFCAIWTESIWAIAEATKSKTKFIVSDHPATVYNRECHPSICCGYNDPDIRYNGTHTIFPLSQDQVLILTNLSWVRNPYKAAVVPRPNPDLFRDAIAYTRNIQIGRQLTEEEVREINFIIKARAYRHIAAGKEEWLYPEKYVSATDWAEYGHGYLLMPDPRPIPFTGEIIIGFRDGSATAFDEYGRRPWQADYKQKSDDHDTFGRFQKEFEHLFGSQHRGYPLESLDLGFTSPT